MTIMNMEQHMLKNMFEKSLFSDLSLVFYHDSYPFAMRFDVHKGVVAQSSFFRLLLENTHRLTTVDTDSADQVISSDQSSSSSSSQISNGALHLNIDLIQAMTGRGFNMTPSQHIIRRQWQTQTASLNETAEDSTTRSRHILNSHLRFALKWMYSYDRTSMVATLQDEDTLRVLCVAVLFGLDTLVDECLERYTTHQLSIDAITNDLETIRQLPRNHKAYQQLRDAALLLLLRLGPQYPRHLARLPVDYMSDILSVDLLYVGSEYERYCLLREVLVAYMQSVGKITWTSTGPVDQDFKRLSGFVQTPHFQQDLSASDVRSSKRKRIPSEELVLDTTKQQRRDRLSFSACVPFEKLVADASSGGVIDKATILSYLLRTTVNYSNMTFDQLAIIRQDGIVGESIVFRAFWQRKELERIFFPFNYQQSQDMPCEKTTHQTIIPRFGKLGKNTSGDTMDRRAALDEYFDVADTDGKGKRRRMLLGTPRYRFCASIPLVLPSTDGDDGWARVKVTGNETTVDSIKQSHTIEDDGPSDIFDDDDNGNGDDDDDDDNDSIWVCEDETEPSTEKHTTLSQDVHTLNRLTIGEAATKATENDGAEMKGKQPASQQIIHHWIQKKTVYSEPECILGHWHRVRLEVQLLPRSMVAIQTESGEDDNVLVCRFELQRDSSAMATTSTQQQDEHPSTGSAAPHGGRAASQQTKIRYDIYCLNRHQVIDDNDHVDPEDRVLVPVSKVTEANDTIERSSGYVKQVMLNMDSLDGGKELEVDMVVALEIFGFQKL